MSRLEILPSEILDPILDYCPWRDGSVHELSVLMRCSKRLYSRVQDRLYSPSHLRDRALRWACRHGVLGTIQKAVAHGADPSVCLDTSQNASRSVTLAVAIKYGHLKVFTLLLELGAGLGGIELSKTELEGFRRNIARHLCRPGNSQLLRLFFDSGVARQIELKKISLACLNTALVGGYPFDNVDFLLKQAIAPEDLARPVIIRAGKRFMIASSISAASALPTSELLCRLLARGADIHGPQTSLDGHGNVILYDKAPFVSPILCAIRGIGKHGSLESLNRLIAAGVSLRSYKLLPLGSTRHFIHPLTHSVSRSPLGVWGLYQTSPLLIYLDAIDYWESNVGGKVSPANQLIPAIRRLNHLGHSLLQSQSCDSASAAGTKSVELVGSSSHAQYHRSHDFNVLKPPHPIYFLLCKWGFSSLRFASFFEAMQAVMELPLAPVEIKDLLEKLLRSSIQCRRSRWRYDHRKETPLFGGPCQDTVFSRWGVILGMALVGIEASSRDKLLSDFLIYSSSVRTSLCPNCYSSNSVAELIDICAKSFLSAGANVNARGHYGGRTVLHKLCATWNPFEPFDRVVPIWDSIQRHQALAERRRDFLMCLVGFGSDPALVDDDGNTALDLLSRHVKPSADNMASDSIAPHMTTEYINIVEKGLSG